MNNLGTIVLTLINGDEKTIIIPQDMALEIQKKLSVEIEKALTKLHSKDCPHASPFRYCQNCVVSPCPIGIKN